MHTAMELFCVHTDADASRYSIISRILTESSHPLLPRIKGTRPSEDDRRRAFLVETHVIHDEAPLVDSVLQKITPQDILALLESFCTLLGMLAIAGAAHGAIHESSLYYSADRRRFVLRNFASSTDEIVGNDVGNFIRMAVRICSARGMQLRLAPVHAQSAALPMIADAIATMRAHHSRHAALSIHEERANLPFLLMQNARAQQFAVNRASDNAIIEIVYAVYKTITDPGLHVPFFSYTGSPGMGFGPTRQIINDFFNTLMLARVLVYRTPAPDTPAFAWPTLPGTARQGLQTRTLYVVLGNLIVYSRLMNFATDVVFSPVLLRLLLTRPEDAGRAGTPTAHDGTIILPLLGALSLMNEGAQKYAKFIADHAIMPESLCSVPEAPTTAESVLRSVDFAPDMAPHRIRTFKRWLARLSTGDLGRFLRLVTGGCTLVRGVDRIRVLAPKGETHLRVSVCAREICIPGAALDSDEVCRAVFEPELAGSDDFNDK